MISPSKWLGLQAPLSGGVWAPPDTRHNNRREGLERPLISRAERRPLARTGARENQRSRTRPFPGECSFPDSLMGAAVEVGA